MNHQVSWQMPSPSEPICWCSVLFYCGFISICLLTNDIEHLFVFLLAILNIFCRNISPDILTFFNQIICLQLTFMCSVQLGCLSLINYKTNWNQWFPGCCKHVVSLTKHKLLTLCGPIYLSLLLQPKFFGVIPKTHHTKGNVQELFPYPFFKHCLILLSFTFESFVYF